MNRRSFAKALASVAGAFKLTPEKAVSSIHKGASMPIPLNWPEDGVAMHGCPPPYPSEPVTYALSNPWARRPSDPPLTLEQQLQLRDYDRTKIYSNSDRFYSIFPHPVSKSKNQFISSMVHNQHDRYSTRRHFRDWGPGNPIENWVKDRRNLNISAELGELRELLNKI